MANILLGNSSPTSAYEVIQTKVVNHEEFHPVNMIFDRVVSIPQKLILDVPNPPCLCNKIGGLAKHSIAVESGSLYSEEEGAGVPLLLINGGPGGTHHCFHPYFSKAKDFAHLIYYDQRGTGLSSKDETGKTYTIQQAVEDIESLRKAYHIDRWAVLGWSYGGLLAQCYALTYPEHVSGLVLVASADALKNVKLKPDREQLFMSEDEVSAIRRIQSNTSLNEIQILYNSTLAGDWKRQNLYQPTLEESALQSRYEWSPSPGFRELIGRDMEKIGLDGKFDDFEIPTLVMEGKWDLTWDVDKVDAMRHNHPHGQFELFERSSHCIFHDESDRFFSILRQFLESSSRQQISYKPGHRIEWPVEASELLRMIAVKGGSYSDYYEEALTKNILDVDFWANIVGEMLSAKRGDDKCFIALQKLEYSMRCHDSKQWFEWGFGIKTLQGHVLDILGRRELATECYREALDSVGEKEGDFFISHIDRKRICDCLVTPFKWE